MNKRCQSRPRKVFQRTEKSRARHNCDYMRQQLVQDIMDNGGVVPAGKMGLYLMFFTQRQIQNQVNKINNV